METRVTDPDLVEMMQHAKHVETSHVLAVASPSSPGDLPPTDQFEEIATPPGLDPHQSFGEWLLEQKDRKGWIGDLAKAAKTDRDFPKRGSPDAVRKRLQQMGADGDVFEALDDAERDWASF